MNQAKTFELRVRVVMQTQKEQLAWYETIATLRRQRGCIDVVMQPLEDVEDKIDEKIPQETSCWAVQYCATASDENYVDYGEFTAHDAQAALDMCFAQNDLGEAPYLTLDDGIWVSGSWSVILFN